MNIKLFLLLQFLVISSHSLLASQRGRLNLNLDPTYNYYFPREHEDERLVRDLIRKVYVEFDESTPRLIAPGVHEIPRFQVPSLEEVFRYKASPRVPSRIIALDIPMARKRLYAIPGTAQYGSVKYMKYHDQSSSPFLKLGYPCCFMVELLTEIDSTGLNLNQSKKNKELRILIALATQMSRVLDKYPSLAVACRNARTRSPSYLVSYLILFHGMTESSAYKLVNDSYNRPYPGSEARPWSYVAGAQNIDRNDRYKNLRQILPAIAARANHLKTAQEKRFFYYNLIKSQCNLSGGLPSYLPEEAKSHASSDEGFADDFAFFSAEPVKQTSSTKAKSSSCGKRKISATLNPRQQEVASSGSASLAQSSQRQASQAFASTDQSLVEVLLEDGFFGFQKLGYTCTKCQRMKYTKEDFLDHWNRKHSGQNPFDESGVRRNRFQREIFVPDSVQELYDSKFTPKRKKLKKVRAKKKKVRGTKKVKAQRKPRQCYKKQVFDGRVPRKGDQVWVLFKDGIKYKGELLKTQNTGDHERGVMIRFHCDEQIWSLSLLDGEKGTKWNFIDPEDPTWSRVTKIMPIKTSERVL